MNTFKITTNGKEFTCSLGAEGNFCAYPRTGHVVLTVESAADYFRQEYRIGRVDGYEPSAAIARNIEHWKMLAQGIVASLAFAFSPIGNQPMIVCAECNLIIKRGVWEMKDYGVCQACRKAISAKSHIVK